MTLVWTLWNQPLTAHRTNRWLLKCPTDRCCSLKYFGPRSTRDYTKLNFSTTICFPSWKCSSVHTNHLANYLQPHLPPFRLPHDTIPFEIGCSDPCQILETNIRVIQSRKSIVQTILMDMLLHYLHTYAKPSSSVMFIPSYHLKKLWTFPQFKKIHPGSCFILR